MGFVYVMRAGQNFKIGYTGSAPLKRMRALQTSSALPVYLIGAIDGTGADEGRLHRKYAAKRLAGEWFALSWTDVGEILDGGVPAGEAVIAEPEPDGQYADVLADNWYPDPADAKGDYLLPQIKAAWPDGEPFASEMQLSQAIRTPGNWWGNAFSDAEQMTSFVAMLLMTWHDIRPVLMQVDGEPVSGYLRSDFPWAQTDAD
jgi:T5orf172 domain